MRHLLLILASAAAACTAAIEPSGTADQAVSSELTLPLTARSLTRELVRRGVTSKSDALALLPKAFKQRFVLMKETGALGTATPERPRIIHFEESGRFTLASTGYEDELEILEEDPATHQYRTHSIRLDAKSGVTLTEDDQRCRGCHGFAPARPIWGAYPNWPGAYGAHENIITPEERPTFDAFVETAKTDPDYRHLEIYPTSTGFYLPVPYGYPNTALNAALGNRWAYQLAERMTTSPRYAQLANAVVMASMYCNYSRETEAFIDRLYASNHFDAEARYPARRATTKVYRLLGVEPTTDLRVEKPVPVAPTVDWEIGMSPWNAGSDALTNLVAYPIFSALLKQDPTLEQLYASKRQAIAYADDISVKGDLAMMMSLTDDSSPSYYDATHFGPYGYLHAPVLDGEGKRAAVCGRLQAAQSAAQ